MKSHGQSGTKLYQVWKNMKNRCYNKFYTNAKCWNGKGIKMCHEWRVSFEVFAAWATANGYKEGLILDRRESAKGYSPDNCRWVTSSESNSNKGDNVNVTAFGETKTLQAWSKDPRCAVSRTGLQHRLKLGYMPERAITQQRMKSNQHIIEGK